jgi:hypothetical protein
MNEEVFDPNDAQVAFSTHAIRFAAWYVAISTATVLLWMYLVVGEFVLSGLPEWLGWFAVILATGASYWAAERQLFQYLTAKTLWQRLTTLFVVGCLFAMALLTALVLGALLPEPAVTVMLLILAGIITWWKRGVRRRLYPALPRDQGLRVVARVTIVGVVTLAAAGALLSRL